MRKSIKKTILLGTALSFLVTISVSATHSGTAVVNSDLHSSHWKTVFTNAVSLDLNWNKDATSAKLEICGMSGSLTTNFTAVTSNYLWQVFTADVPTEEDVYALTLTYYTNDTQIVESMTSHLAVVKGAFGIADINTLSTSPKWSKVTGNVVIPYDSYFSEAATNAVTSQLVITKDDGLAQTNTFPDTVGYYGWKLANSEWGYGTFELSLTFPETATDALTASLIRRMGGMVIIVM